MRSAITMKGYHKNPQATRDTITPDGWLVTGETLSVPFNSIVY
jgi:long-subunit acyl-CoA synthetase (AMP-forming)